MKISEIPNKESITSAEISSGYMLGMKNVYPDDKVPVHELERFPLTAYISDVDLQTAKQLITKLRNLNSDIIEQKEKIDNFVSHIQTITSAEVSSANLQTSSNVMSYDIVTAQLASKFASPQELQTAVNNVYKSLFSSIEEIMVQVFTTSMYARQYTQITDDREYTED
jgi:hypothetical protein